MKDEQEPVFPPELEEFIFSLAIQDDVTLAAKFCLVAKRVHTWMIPRIYEVVIFNREAEDIPHSNLPFENLANHGGHVRHLLMHGMVSALKNNCHICVRRCPNLRSLGLWCLSEIAYTPNMIDALSRLKLEYLSFDMHALLTALTQHGRTITFPTVTHLELISSVKDPGQVKELFPALTHLAISSFGGTPPDLVTDTLAVFGDQLKVVVWYLWQYQREEPSPRVVYSTEFVDPRVVVMWYGSNFTNSWNEGVKGRLGIWRAADEAILARGVGTKKA